MITHALLGILLTLPSATDPAAPPKPKPLVIKAGRLFDGSGDALLSNQLILVEGERITAVGPADKIAIPEGAEIIDLTKFTVLPGLIDCHTHLSTKPDRYDEGQKFKESPFHKAFAAVKNAKATLEAGFTTIRDLGGPPFLAADVRTAVDDGVMPGPRIVASGPSLSQTGGHGDMNGYAPQLHMNMFPEERDFRIADGVDQVRQTVRAQMKHGVDVIKINATGGVFSRGDTPGAPQYSMDELRAAVEEAHAGGRKIAAHAHGAQGIKNAVNAGVDSIEHGSLIDDEGIALMVKRGTWLVSDVYNDDYILAQAETLKIPKEYVEKERKIGQLQRDNFAKCVKAGVKIAYGTDSGIYPHGDNAKQFAIMVKYGLTPAQAIRSATSSAAELLGRSKDVGRIAPGLYADLIAVPADPLLDVSILEKPPFVMKGGKTVKNDHPK